jgi:hypothetical protein
MSFANPAGVSPYVDHQVWMTDSGQVAIGKSGTGGLSNVSADSYNDGNWHYLVAVQYGGRTSLYVDGQLVAEAKAPNPVAKAGHWVVGYGTPSNKMTGPSDDYFAGTISDVAFYDFNLKASAIQNEFSASSAGS